MSNTTLNNLGMGQNMKSNWIGVHSGIMGVAGFNSDIHHAG